MQPDVVVVVTLQRQRQVSIGRAVEQLLVEAFVPQAAVKVFAVAILLGMAREWFAEPCVQAISSAPYEVGGNKGLRYAKLAVGFTIGDAMRDFVEWKRVAAAQSHIDTILSLINFHIIPRLGDVHVIDFSNRQFTTFCVDVSESTKKLGNRAQGARVRLAEIPQEALRK